MSTITRNAPHTHTHLNGRDGDTRLITHMIYSDTFPYSFLNSICGRPLRSRIVCRARPCCRAPLSPPCVMACHKVDAVVAFLKAAVATMGETEAWSGIVKSQVVAIVDFVGRRHRQFKMQLWLCRRCRALRRHQSSQRQTVRPSRLPSPHRQHRQPRRHRQWLRRNVRGRATNRTSLCIIP